MWAWEGFSPLEVRPEEKKEGLETFYEVAGFCVTHVHTLDWMAGPPTARHPWREVAQAWPLRRIKLDQEPAGGKLDTRRTIAKAAGGLGRREVVMRRRRSSSSMRWCVYAMSRSLLKIPKVASVCGSNGSGWLSARGRVWVYDSTLSLVSVSFHIASSG